MTPILMGSAARAWPDAVAKRPSAAAPRSLGRDRDKGDRVAFVISFLSTLTNFLAFLPALFINLGGILAVPAPSASETLSHQLHPRETKVEATNQARFANAETAGVNGWHRQDHGRRVFSEPIRSIGTVSRNSL
jgi:hypothetical protein